MVLGTTTTARATFTNNVDAPKTVESTSSKNWFRELSIPRPSGLYLKIEGKEFFLGDYAPTGELEYPGSLWEVRVDGKLAAHGYGETPRWVMEIAQKYFDF